ncbi:DUF5357 family protein [Aerosakkonemataceae cyanobacterium BLCC-F154]|uniref:DUF5357 family protein n=1 Tax=Floridaenema fluviatile BLCC-F154 TaxID=3153640 RepID=A0ABV4YIJ2_9CYAN
MNKIIQIIEKISALIIFIKSFGKLGWKIIIGLGILFWIIAFSIGLLAEDLRFNLFSILIYFVVVAIFAFFTLKNPLITVGVSLSTWMLVGLICLFVASLWQNIAPLIWLLMPPLSAIIAAWPSFLAADKKLKNLKNQQRFQLLIWVFIHLIVSCWINLSLIIQDWVQQYPSLLADNFTQSDFIVKIQPFSRPITEGEKVLNFMERQLKSQIDGKPWQVAETWLNNTNEIEKLLKEAKKEISGIPENKFWKFSTEVNTQKTGYNLVMIAEWQGPSYDPQGYLLKQVCQVNSETRQPTPANTNLRRVRRGNNTRVATTPERKVTAKPVKIANLECQSVSKQIIGQNRVKSSPRL